MRVKCLAQEHNVVPRPRLEPGPLDPESSVTCIMLPHLSFPATLNEVTFDTFGNVLLTKVFFEAAKFIQARFWQSKDFIPTFPFLFV